MATSEEEVEIERKQLQEALDLVTFYGSQLAGGTETPNDPTAKARNLVVGLDRLLAERDELWERLNWIVQHLHGRPILKYRVDLITADERRYLAEPLAVLGYSTPATRRTLPYIRSKA